jgi:hypothetical protein
VFGGPLTAAVFDAHQASPKRFLMVDYQTKPCASLPAIAPLLRMSPEKHEPETDPHRLFLLAPFRQRCGRFFSVFGRKQQLSDRYLEGFCQPIESFYRRILDPALDTTDIRPVDTGVHGQRFLRHPMSHPQSPKIPSHKSRRLHGPNKRLCGPLKHAL